MLVVRNPVQLVNLEIRNAVSGSDLSINNSYCVYHAFIICHYIAKFYSCNNFCRVFSFVFSEPVKRLSLCIYWVCVTCFSVLRFYNISKNSKIERILLRKYYHLLAVLMFLPALIFQVIWDLLLASFFPWVLYMVIYLSDIVLSCSLLFWFQPTFLDLAFGAALAVFLTLEIIRVSVYTCIQESNSCFIYVMELVKVIVYSGLQVSVCRMNPNMEE